MSSIETHQAFQIFKILGDSHRLDILRRLMTKPATLSQLGKMLDKSPAWIRHHLKILEKAGLVDMITSKTTGRNAKKYYQARTNALVLQELVLPYSQKPVIFFSGSLDPGIQQIAHHLASNISLVIQPDAPLDSLVNLRQGLCHIAGINLRDINGDYNTPFVKNLFIDKASSVFTLAHRSQGLIVAEKNPKGINTLQDLFRDDVRFINRNPGSGTRVWLEQELAKQGISTSSMRGFADTVNNHTAAVKMVESGQADVAVGIAPANTETGVSYIPLSQERYDLVILDEYLELANPLLAYLKTSDFRNSLSHLQGYDYSASGEQLFFREGFYSQSSSHTQQVVPQDRENKIFVEY